MNLNDSVSALHSIGKAREAALKRLAISTIHDLIWYLPVRYEDLSTIQTIKSLTVPTKATVRGRIEKVRVKRLYYRRGLVITEMTIRDETGTLRATWFGQRYLDKTFKVADEIYLAGPVTFDLLGPQMVNPVYEKVKEKQLHTGYLIPFYQLTESVSQKQLRFLIY